jgi:hypothetical protein
MTIYRNEKSCLLPLCGSRQDFFKSGPGDRADEIRRKADMLSLVLEVHLYEESLFNAAGADTSA